MLKEVLEHLPEMAVTRRYESRVLVSPILFANANTARAVQIALRVRS